MTPGAATGLLSAAFPRAGLESVADFLEGIGCSGDAATIRLALERYDDLRNRLSVDTAEHRIEIANLLARLAEVDAAFPDEFKMRRLLRDHAAGPATQKVGYERQ